MKRTPLLHAELSQVIAAMGHGDLLVIGDAGLPIPPGVRRIDLALTRGVPTVSQVLEAVLAELRVEQMLLARESLTARGALPLWLQPDAPWLPEAPMLLSHEEFKARSRQACAVVRTGECTPYANIGLVSGVVF
ncbi:MAG: D-ribose pyranase [Comamonas sp.]